VKIPGQFSAQINSTGRNYLAHRSGDAINAVLAAVGYNFSLLLKWLRLLCAMILEAIVAASPDRRNSKPLKPGSSRTTI
jgi:hypothetical protein